ncbi:MAG: F0F1 ATP synthase subunit B [bacterium]|nr:F0F1 ATP synthase subunit B [bacterium]
MEIFKTLGIDWRLLIAQLVNFAILLVILQKLLYKPIMNVLDKRTATIEKSLQDAQAIEERLKDAEKTRAETVQKARSEAERILEQAQEIAEQKQQAMLDKARIDVRMIIDQAKDKIESEKSQMLLDAKREIVDLVMKTTQAVLGDLLTKDTSREYTSKAIEKVKQKVAA